MSRSTSGIFLISCAVVSGLCGTAGCLVDDAETPAAGATGATGATGGSSGSSGTGGSAGSATTDMCVVGAPANQCAKAGVPVDGVVVDFATFMAPAGTWGVSSVGDLTGGTSLYSGEGMPTITNTPEAGSLKMSVLIPAMGYAGNVFWFGPCTDSTKFRDDDATINGTTTPFTGLTFTVGGLMNGAKLSVQVQTHDNYPVDGAKGGCTAFTDCATRWDTCVGPKTTVEVPEAAAVVNLPWSAFTGGTPNAAVTPDALVGLQFQLECQSETECQVDMTLGTISFSTTP